MNDGCWGAEKACPGGDFGGRYLGADVPIRLTTRSRHCSARPATAWAMRRKSRARSARRSVRETRNCRRPGRSGCALQLPARLVQASRRSRPLMEDVGSYDYVVVGAGSAGCALAAQAFGEWPAFGAAAGGWQADATSGSTCRSASASSCKMNAMRGSSKPNPGNLFCRTADILAARSGPGWFERAQWHGLRLG